MNTPFKPPSSAESSSGFQSGSHPGKPNKSSDPARPEQIDQSRGAPEGWLNHAALSFVTRAGLRRALRVAQWNLAGLLLLSIVGLFGWASVAWLRSAARKASEETGDYSPPRKEIHSPPIVIANNKIAERRFAVNLEGTAVVYSETVNMLVDIDGRFCTKLSASALAKLLGVALGTIAKKGSSLEVDPGAVLFMAVIGKLTEGAKTHSRRMRQLEADRGEPPSAVADGWLLTEMPFCLNDLVRPTPDQKRVLDAIRDVALCVPRQPGAKINAAPIHPFPEGNQWQLIKFHGGDLPLEPLPAGSTSPAGVDR